MNKRTKQQITGAVIVLLFIAFIFGSCALLYNQRTPPSPTAVPIPVPLLPTAIPTSQVVSTLEPFTVEVFIPTTENIVYSGDKTVLQLAQEYHAVNGGSLDSSSDLALIVEGIPGAKCRTTICVAEVYLNAGALLQSDLLGHWTTDNGFILDVRIPRSGAALTFGSVCEIAKISTARGYFQWEENQINESALFLGWEDQGPHLGAVGWNWYKTIWNANQYDIMTPSEEAEFWGRIHRTILEPCAE